MNIAKGILTEKQQAVWDLKKQGMTRKKIAETLSITPNMVTTHLKNIDRRFKEHERYMAMKEKDSKIVDIQFTRGELKTIVEAIQEYEHAILKRAHFNVKTDWEGRLPYGADRAQRISERIQKEIYGSVLFGSLFASEEEERTDKTETE